MKRHADAWSAVRGRPWRFLTSAWPWRSLAYLASTVPLGIGVLLVLTAVIALGALTAVIVAGLLLLASLPLVTTVIAEIERARLRLVLPQPSGGERPRLRERLRTWRTLPVSWPEIGYAVLLATVGWLVDAVVLTLAITTPIVLILAPVLVRYDAVELFGWRIDHAAEAGAALAVGVLALAVAAYLVTVLASAQAALARLLLDPPEARLVAAVTELRRSRAGVVDAFEAERRRIERDLHDGAQQRLVALTMTLGQAELELNKGPAFDLVTRAHTLAEEALEDLRATVRGIHPRVLTDHGLAAAIHELADRSPVPVDTELHLAGRLPARVETAAYFLVSEALTNVARHSGARGAQVHAWVAGNTLTMAVVDDGHGGADPARGSGLAGLAARIDAIDGTLDITSPPGGPTNVRMTCPISVN
ncbi:sensor histidine kinase [Micromonospora eburnea]|uniref:histidine kinase n=1 Tax=Micromonospora eburnea TaxID=227316 RepID=A0A1C6UA51_9ACTN|nr:sensor domain-containing protein [Micromonospora eburnea]SCL50970.1 Signal transduction histidine kinase [Micromonospora eburnea]